MPTVALDRRPELEERRDRPQLIAIAKLNDVRQIGPQRCVGQNLERHVGSYDCPVGAVDRRVAVPDKSVERCAAAADTSNRQWRLEEDIVDDDFRHAAPQSGSLRRG